MIKGEAKIELTHVKTGEKEVYTEENMTTNFFKDILNFKFRKADFYSLFFPLYKKGLGGILLFGENIEEDKNNYLPPANANLVGHANSEAYMGTNTLRGSFNEAESGELENGYRFVWDFGTAQANGEIKCISLTHTNGGKVGLGAKDGEEKTSHEFLLLRADIASGDPQPDYFKDLDYGYRMVTSTTGVTINKYLDNLNLVTLKSSEKIVASQTYDLQATELNTFNYFQNDTHIYISACKAITGNVVKVAKINKKTLEMEKLIDLSQHNKVVNNIQIVVIDQYLYVTTSTYDTDSYYFATPYKINLNNPTDIIQYDTIRYYNKSGSSDYEPLRVVGDYCGRYLTTLFMIDQNDKLWKLKAGDYFPQSPIKNIYKNIVYWNAFRHRSLSSTYYYYTLLMTYLATINNLSTPVTKTADKTMKITYVVTEV